MSSADRLHDELFRRCRTVVRGDVRLGDDVEVGEACLLGEPGEVTVVGRRCRIGDHAKLGGAVSLDAACLVGDHAVIGHPTKADVAGTDAASTSPRTRGFLRDRKTELGARSVVRSHSIIYRHVGIGPELSTGHHVLIREHTTIGDRCVFGSYASCDGYTRIGDDAHIGQYAQLSQAARIGDGVFIGGHSVLSDNPKALRRVAEDLRGARIGDFVRIGLACVILPGVRVEHDAMIGAGSVVTRDVPSSVLAFGSPCEVRRELSPAEIEDYRESVREGRATPSNPPSAGSGAEGG